MDPDKLLEATLRGLPDDWDSWLVYADSLSRRDDARGQLLVLEHKLETSTLSTTDALALRRCADALTSEWMETFRERLSGDDANWCDWYSRLSALARFERTAPGLLTILARPGSQLLATLEVGDDKREGLSPPLELQRDRVIASVIEWISRAFDGVPVPAEGHATLHQAEAADGYGHCDRSRDHLGRWQDLPDSQLMDNQWALPHLDAHGIHYYVPAAMCFALRHLHRAHPDDSWLTESLEYTLQPSRAVLRDYEQARLGLLDRDQRATIYAFTLTAGHEKAAAAWAPVFAAEQQAERGDWFDLYSPVPGR